MLSFSVTFITNTFEVKVVKVENKFKFSILYKGKTLNGYALDDPLRGSFDSEEEAANTALSLILWP